MLAISMVVMAGCGLSLMTALISVRLHDAGFSARAIGFNTAASGIATLVAAPFLPRLAQRWGIVPILFAALAGSAGITLAFPLFRTYPAWLLLRFSQGLCATALFALSEFWITSVTSPERRSLIIGIYVACLALGFALGPALAVLGSSTSSLPFVLGAGLFSIATLPLLGGRALAPALGRQAPYPLWRIARAHPAICLAALLHGSIEIGGMAMLPVLGLVQGGGVGLGAFYVALFVLGNSVLQLPIAAMADRFDRQRLLILLAACGAAGAIALPFLLPSAIGFAIALVLWGGVVGAFYPVGLGELSRRYRDSKLAAANSLFVMIYALGILLGPPLVGLGFDLAPPSGMFFAMAALLAGYAVAASIIVFTRTPQEQVAARLTGGDAFL